MIGELSIGGPMEVAGTQQFWALRSLEMCGMSQPPLQARTYINERHAETDSEA